VIAELASLAGSWTGSGRFATNALFPGFEQPQIHVEAAFRHRGSVFEQRLVWIEQHADGLLDLTTATRLWTYDEAARQLVAEWFDDRGRRGTMRSSGWEGDELVTIGPVTVAGHTATARETFTRSANGQWEHHTEAELGSGWIEVDRQKFQRLTRGTSM
jgi:hypothetical protein